MSLSQHAVKIIPFFTSPHLPSLLTFYKTYFPDFTISPHPTDTTDPTFASIWTGPAAAANIYIIQDEKRARGSCMIMIDSVTALEELYARLVAQGLLQPSSDAAAWTGIPVSASTPALVHPQQTRLGPCEDKPWGYRQFDLVDLHGNLIVFFAFLSE
ncbi:hypothetical protein AYO21_05565 [Fonsecaea monophora]|uniref:VOC domain-containing protein n=1 Tax=Fonsecaea monophora TaxID=254056 RepID=A0A177FA37_9EURO|nr:hypothetical protein AYO21_05565 [Fonsecaea monophora]KAH0845640.1 hypothetical protein FOPE_12591 [Fonsecaea pedrosoi]OAG40282.1 hypothetical protein AYO21_05565 [Fonsecaea monophora]